MSSFQKKRIKRLERRVEERQDNVLALEEEIALLQEAKRLKEREEGLVKKRDDLQSSI